MVDKFSREIDYLRISVTDRCNLRCTYCMPEEGVDFIPHDEILRYEEIIHLCRCFVQLGVSKVKITGGEPLVRKNLSYLIKSIKEIEGIENVTITTNGVLLADQVGDLVEAGIDGINVSLDTLNSDHFKSLTRFDRIHQVKEGIKEALKYEDIILKINCVPLNTESVEDILDIVSLAKDNRIHVRFIEVMPIGMGKKQEGFTEEDLKQVITKEHGILTPCEAAIGNGPANYYSLSGFKGKIGFISAVSHKFCSSCNRIRLTSDGYLKTCLNYTRGVDLKEPLRNEVGDQELINIIHLAIADKPKEHHFNEDNKKDNLNKKELNSICDTDELDKRRMSQIGG